MGSNAIGFNPLGQVTAGLRPGKQSTGGQAASQAAAGAGMAGAAALNMDRAKSNQDLGVQNMQAESQQRQQNAQTQTQRGGNESQARIQGGELANRKSTFDMGMAFSYAELHKRKQIQRQQSILSGLAKEF